MFAGAYTAKERVQWPIRKRRAKKKKIKNERKDRERKENCNSLKGLFERAVCWHSRVSSFNAMDGRRKWRWKRPLRTEWFVSMIVFFSIIQIFLDTACNGASFVTGSILRTMENRWTSCLCEMWAASNKRIVWPNVMSSYCLQHVWF